MSQSQTKTEFTLTPEQSKFAQSKKRYVGYVSGVGAGKTFAGISRTLRNMLAWNPGELGAVVAPTRTMVQDVIVNELRDLGIFERGWEYASSQAAQPGISAPNGSRALVLSADNARTVERLKGLNLAWWWIDEEAEVPPRAREILMQRLRTGEYRNGTITTTPKGRNHTWEFFVDDPDTTSYEHGAGTVYESATTLAVTGVPTNANPYTPDDYHEDMADLPEAIRQQEVEGQFIEIGGGVFRRDMLQWVKPDTVPSHLTPVIGVDPAATADAQAAMERDSDFWGVTVAYPHPSQGQLYVADTVQRRGMTLQEGVSFVEQIALQCESPRLVVESNQSQRWLQQELQDRGLQAVPIQTTRNKKDKIIDLSIPVASGQVRFVDWGDDTFDALHQQLLSWPDSPHDDMVDSLAMVVNHGGADVSQTMFSGSYMDKQDTKW